MGQSSASSKLKWCHLWCFLALWLGWSPGWPVTTVTTGLMTCLGQLGFFSNRFFWQLTLHFCELEFLRSIRENHGKHVKHVHPGCFPSKGWTQSGERCYFIVDLNDDGALNISSEFCFSAVEMLFIGEFRKKHQKMYPWWSPISYINISLYARFMFH